MCPWCRPRQLAVFCRAGGGWRANIVGDEELALAVLVRWAGGDERRAGRGRRGAGVDFGKSEQSKAALIGELAERGGASPPLVAGDVVLRCQWLPSANATATATADWRGSRSGRRRVAARRVRARARRRESSGSAAAASSAPSASRTLRILAAARAPLVALAARFRPSAFVFLLGRPLLASSASGPLPFFSAKFFSVRRAGLASFRRPLPAAPPPGHRSPLLLRRQCYRAIRAFAASPVRRSAVLTARGRCASARFRATPPPPPPLTGFLSTARATARKQLGEA